MHSSRAIYSCSKASRWSSLGAGLLGEASYDGHRSPLIILLLAYVHHERMRVERTQRVGSTAVDRAVSAPIARRCQRPSATGIVKLGTIFIKR